MAQAVASLFGAALARRRAIHSDCMNSPDQMDENKKQVAGEILQYLIDHPNAQDTLDGIVTWWLLERTVRHRTILVKEVLDNLVADGLVIATKGGAAQTHYRINLRHRKKIISLLKQKS